MKKILASILALCGASAAMATVVYQSNTAFSGWVAGTDITNTGTGLLSSGSGSNGALYYFTPTTLTAGESLTLTLDFNVNTGAGVSSSRSFYATLLNSNGNTKVTTIASAGLSSASFDTYSGYGAIVNPAPSTASAGQFDYRNETNSTLINSTSPWVTPAGIGSMPSTSSTLVTGQNYQLDFTVTFATANTIDFSYQMYDLTTSTEIQSQTATSGVLSGVQLNTTFDTVAIGANAAQTGKFDYTSVTISTVPEPSACAMLTGVLALGFVALRRRSAKQAAV